MKLYKSTVLAATALVSLLGMSAQAPNEYQQGQNSMLSSVLRGAIARAPIYIGVLQSARKSGDASLSALASGVVGNQLMSTAYILADSNNILSLPDDLNRLWVELKSEGEAVRSTCSDLKNNDCDANLAEAQATLNRIRGQF